MTSERMKKFLGHQRNVRGGDDYGEDEVALWSKEWDAKSADQTIAWIRCFDDIEEVEQQVKEAKEEAVRALHAAQKDLGRPYPNTRRGQDRYCEKIQEWIAVYEQTIRVLQAKADAYQRLFDEEKLHPYIALESLEDDIAKKEKVVAEIEVLRQRIREWQEHLGPRSDANGIKRVPDHFWDAFAAMRYENAQWHAHQKDVEDQRLDLPDTDRQFVSTTSNNGGQGLGNLWVEFDAEGKIVDESSHSLRMENVKRNGC